MKKRLIVTGYGEHGKDAFCEVLEILFGYSHISSSEFASKIVFEKIGEKYGYKDAKEAWLDRRNHRDEWFTIIANYNSEDLSKLAKGIFAEYDIYSGIRNLEEFNECKKQGLYDLAIWVDASERLPPESGESITVRKEDCDVVFDNNEFLENPEKDMEDKVYKFAKENDLIPN